MSSKPGCRSSLDQVGVRVAMTPVGKGIFASHDFPATSVIGEIQGEVIDEPNYGSPYCFDLGDGLNLEPIPPFRFVNHSCDPNCEFDCMHHAESPNAVPKLTAFLIALRDIPAGEELTIDYNWPATFAIRCLCGSSECRGWVVSEDVIDQAVERSRLEALSKTAVDENRLI